MPRLLALLTFVLAAAGCRPDAAPPVAGAGDAAAAQVATVPTSRPAAGSYVVDETCELDTTFAHPDPDRLLAEFLARDAAGQFLRTDAWFASAAECPGHEPAPDGYVLIERYTIAPLPRMGDTARVAVTSVSPGMRVAGAFRPDARTIVDTVAAIHTPWGWRIRSPALRQFVHRAAADSLDRAMQALVRADSSAGTASPDR